MFRDINAALERDIENDLRDDTTICRALETSDGKHTRKISLAQPPFIIPEKP